MFHRTLMIFLSVFLLFGQSVSAATQWYISDEQDFRAGSGSVAEQYEQARAVVETQDDAWRAAKSAEERVLQGNFGVGDDVVINAEPYTYIYEPGSSVDISLRHMDGDTLGSFLSSGSRPKLYTSTNGTLQDEGPVPTSLFGTRIRNENTGGGTSPTTGFLNAILFTFDGVVKGFGAWFGDVETRTDGEGVTAMAYVYDEDLNLIGSQPIAPTLPVADQFDCGGDSFQLSPAICGNETTRRVGFYGDEEFKHMLVVVGDDDDPLDGGTNDGNSEHLSFIGPTVILSCIDSDDDGYCDDVDDCPTDETKRDENNIGCGCNINEPDNLGEECAGSVENECAEVGMGTIQCDGSCLAPPPSVPAYVGAACELSDVCGTVYTGSYDCEESCEVYVPLPDDSDEDDVADCVDVCPDLSYQTTNGGPEGFNTECTTATNNCGASGTGAVLCDGSCSAVLPNDEVIGVTCTSASNDCGETAVGVTICGGGCTATIPSNPDQDNDSVLDCNDTCPAVAHGTDSGAPSDFGTACSKTSNTNACGASVTTTGTILCDGSCDAGEPTMPVALDSDEDDVPDCIDICDDDAYDTQDGSSTNFGDTCTSDNNSCGLSSTGTILCDGSCSASIPADTDTLGDACTSIANACGDTVSGLTQCDGSCGASTPPLASDYGMACSTDANVCGDTATGVIGCDSLCSVGVDDIPVALDTDEDGVPDCTDVCVDDAYETTAGGPDTLDTICTSSENNCGEVGTGSYVCDGSCDAIAPVDEVIGVVCESEANTCGIKGEGATVCGGGCDAIIPSLPDEYDTACTSVANSCGMTNTGTIACDASCNAEIPLDSLCPVARVSSGGGGGGGGSSRRSTVAILTTGFCGDNIVQTDLGEECDLGSATDTCGADCKKKSALIQVKEILSDVDLNMFENIPTDISESLIIDEEDQPVISKEDFALLLDTGPGPEFNNSLTIENAEAPLGTVEFTLPSFLPNTGADRNMMCL